MPNGNDPLSPEDYLDPEEAVRRARQLAGALSRSFLRNAGGGVWLRREEGMPEEEEIPPRPSLGLGDWPAAPRRFAYSVTHPGWQIRRLNDLLEAVWDEVVPGESRLGDIVNELWGGKLKERAGVGSYMEAIPGPSGAMPTEASEVVDPTDPAFPLDQESFARLSPREQRLRVARSFTKEFGRGTILLPIAKNILGSETAYTSLGAELKGETAPPASQAESVARLAGEFGGQLFGGMVQGVAGFKMGMLGWQQAQKLKPVRDAFAGALRRIAGEPGAPPFLSSGRLGWWVGNVLMKDPFLRGKLPEATTAAQMAARMEFLSKGVASGLLSSEETGVLERLIGTVASEFVSGAAIMGPYSAAAQKELDYNFSWPEVFAWAVGGGLAGGTIGGGFAYRDFKRTLRAIDELGAAAFGIGGVGMPLKPMIGKTGQSGVVVANRYIDDAGRWHWAGDEGWGSLKGKTGHYAPDPYIDAPKEYATAQVRALVEADKAYTTGGKIDESVLERYKQVRAQAQAAAGSPKRTEPAELLKDPTDTDLAAKTVLTDDVPEPEKLNLAYSLIRQWESKYHNQSRKIVNAALREAGDEQDVGIARVVEQIRALLLVANTHQEPVVKATAIARARSLMGELHNRNLSLKNLSGDFSDLADLHFLSERQLATEQYARSVMATSEEAQANEIGLRQALSKSARASEEDKAANAQIALRIKDLQQIEKLGLKPAHLEVNKMLEPLRMRGLNGLEPGDFANVNINGQNVNARVLEQPDWGRVLVEFSDPQTGATSSMKVNVGDVTPVVEPGDYVRLRTGGTAKITEVTNDGVNGPRVVAEVKEQGAEQVSLDYDRLVEGIPPVVKEINPDDVVAVGRPRSGRVTQIERDLVTEHEAPLAERIVWFSDHLTDAIGQSSIPSRLPEYEAIVDLSMSKPKYLRLLRKDGGYDVMTVEEYLQRVGRQVEAAAEIPVMHGAARPERPGSHINFAQVPDQVAARIARMRGANRMVALMTETKGKLRLVPPRHREGFTTFAVEIPPKADRTTSAAAKRLLAILKQRPDGSWAVSADSKSWSGISQKMLDDAVAEYVNVPQMAEGGKVYKIPTAKIRQLSTYTTAWEWAPAFSADARLPGPLPAMKDAQRRVTLKLMDLNLRVPEELDDALNTIIKALDNEKELVASSRGYLGSTIDLDAIEPQEMEANVRAVQTLFQTEKDGSKNALDYIRSAFRPRTGASSRFVEVYDRVIGNEAKKMQARLDYFLEKHPRPRLSDSKYRGGLNTNEYLADLDDWERAIRGEVAKGMDLYPIRQLMEELPAVESVNGPYGALASGNVLRLPSRYDPGMYVEISKWVNPRAIARGGRDVESAIEYWVEWPSPTGQRPIMKPLNLAHGGVWEDPLLGQRVGPTVVIDPYSPEKEIARGHKLVRQSRLQQAQESIKNDILNGKTPRILEFVSDPSRSPWGYHTPDAIQQAVSRYRRGLLAAMRDELEEAVGPSAQELTLSRRTARRQERMVRRARDKFGVDEAGAEKELKTTIDKLSEMEANVSTWTADELRERAATFMEEFPDVVKQDLSRVLEEVDPWVKVEVPLPRLKEELQIALAARQMVNFDLGQSRLFTLGEYRHPSVPYLYGTVRPTYSWAPDGQGLKGWMAFVGHERHRTPHGIGRKGVNPVGDPKVFATKEDAVGFLEELGFVSPGSRSATFFAQDFMSLPDPASLDPDGLLWANRIVSDIMYQYRMFAGWVPPVVEDYGMQLANAWQNAGLPSRMLFTTPANREMMGVGTIRDLYKKQLRGEGPFYPRTIRPEDVPDEPFYTIVEEGGRHKLVGTPKEVILSEMDMPTTALSSSGYSILKHFTPEERLAWWAKWGYDQHAKELFMDYADIVSGSADITTRMAGTINSDKYPIVRFLDSTGKERVGWLHAGADENGIIEVMTPASKPSRLLTTPDAAISTYEEPATSFYEIVRIPNTKVTRVLNNTDEIQFRNLLDRYDPSARSAFRSLRSPDLGTTGWERLVGLDQLGGDPQGYLEGLQRAIEGRLARFITRDKSRNVVLSIKEASDEDLDLMADMVIRLWETQEPGPGAIGLKEIINNLNSPAAIDTRRAMGIPGGKILKSPGLFAGEIEERAIRKTVEFYGGYDNPFAHLIAKAKAWNNKGTGPLITESRGEMAILEEHIAKFPTLPDDWPLWKKAEWLKNQYWDHGTGMLFSYFSDEGGWINLFEAAEDYALKHEVGRLTRFRKPRMTGSLNLRRGGSMPRTLSEHHPTYRMGYKLGAEATHKRSKHERWWGLWLQNMRRHLSSDQMDDIKYWVNEKGYKTFDQVLAGEGKTKVPLFTKSGKMAMREAFDSYRDMMEQARYDLVRYYLRRGNTWFVYGGPDADDYQKMVLVSEYGIPAEELGEYTGKMFLGHEAFNAQNARSVDEIEEFIGLMKQYEYLPQDLAAQLADNPKTAWMAKDFEFYKQLGIEDYWPMIHRGRLKIEITRPGRKPELIGIATDHTEGMSWLRQLIQQDEAPRHSNQKAAWEKVREVWGHHQAGDEGWGFSFNFDNQHFFQEDLARTLTVKQWVTLIQRMQKAAKLPSDKVMELLHVTGIRTTPRTRMLVHGKPRSANLATLFDDPFHELQTYFSRISQNQYVVDILDAYRRVEKMDEALSHVFGAVPIFPPVRSGYSQPSMNPGFKEALDHLFHSFLGTQSKHEMVLDRLIAHMNYYLSPGGLPAKTYKQAHMLAKRMLAQDPAKARAAEQAFEKMMAEDPAFQKDMWLKSYAARRWAARTTGMQAVIRLGLSPAAAGINSTQWLVFATPKAGIRNTFGALEDLHQNMPYRHWKNWALGKYDEMPEATRELFQFLDDVDTHMVMTRAGTEDLTFGSLNPKALIFKDDAWHEKMRKVSESWSLYLFNKAERVNRVMTALMARRQGLEMGLEGRALIEHARDLIENTQFIYADWALPELMRGPLAKVLFQFKPFAFNALKYETDLVTDVLRASAQTVRTPNLASTKKLVEVGKVMAEHYALMGLAGGLSFPAMHPLLSAAVSILDLAGIDSEEVLNGPAGLYNYMIAHWSGAPLDQLGADFLKAPIGREFMGEGMDRFNHPLFRAKNVLLFGIPGLLSTDVSRRMGISGPEIHLDNLHDIIAGPYGGMVWDLWKAMSEHSNASVGSKFAANIGRAALAAGVMAGSPVRAIGGGLGTWAALDLASAVSGAEGGLRRTALVEPAVLSRAAEALGAPFGPGGRGATPGSLWETQAGRQFIRNLTPTVLRGVGDAWLAAVHGEKLDAGMNLHQWPKGTDARVWEPIIMALGFRPARASIESAVLQFDLNQSQKMKETRDKYIEDIARAWASGNMEQFWRLMAIAQRRGIYVKPEQIESRAGKYMFPYTSQAYEQVLTELRGRK